MNAETPRGQRKLKHANRMAWILLGGFFVAALLEVPEGMFAAFCTGMVGLSGAYVWGNVKSNTAAPPQS